MTQAELDHQFMQQAIEQAQLAALEGEVPVGAVLVRDGQVISKAFNQPITHHDPSAHAEMLALRAAAKAEENYRLPGSTLYVTLEPCTMCAGAIVNSRIGRLVFGADEPRTGAVGSLFDVVRDRRILHQPEVVAGVRAEESGAMLKEFFAAQR